MHIQQTTVGWETLRRMGIEKGKGEGWRDGGVEGKVVCGGFLVGGGKVGERGGRQRW
jgi:hypothetical protein